ncbi:CCDC90 family protein [Bordetella ansorpii]|nr:DUF1640 domain-containing protein [Bordetella ansorpii]
MPAFDTLQYANRLSQAGASEPQANAQSDALAHVLETAMQDLATHQDLESATATLRAETKQLAAELRGEMKQLSAELRGEMKQLSAELRGELGAVRWILGTLCTGVAALIVKSFI